MTVWSQGQLFKGSFVFRKVQVIKIECFAFKTLLEVNNVSIIVFHYKKLEISLFEIVKKPFPSTYPLTLLCMKWVSRDPNIIYLATSFTPINARKFRLYVFIILILEKSCSFFSDNSMEGFCFKIIL